MTRLAICATLPLIVGNLAANPLKAFDKDVIALLMAVLRNPAINAITLGNSFNIANICFLNRSTRPAIKPNSFFKPMKKPIKNGIKIFVRLSKKSINF